METRIDHITGGIYRISTLTDAYGITAHGFGVRERVLGFQDGQTLDLGRHTLRFLETPHVHHRDSMMVFEETTQSLFPADLYLQPGDQPPLVSENLSEAMLEVYRAVGIFAHEDPVREVVDRIEALDPAFVHAMHGGTLAGDVVPAYNRALRDYDFGYRGMLLGRELRAGAAS